MSIFRFKQFSVNQESSPAKITTDATVFASSLHISSDVKRVLEIGTGTGVLSLMLAQRYPEIEIEALEINPKAFEVADNIVFFCPLVKTFKGKKLDMKIKEYGDIKEIIHMGGGNQHGFPFGFSTGCIYYKRDYDGDIKYTRVYN